MVIKLIEDAIVVEHRVDDCLDPDFTKVLLRQAECFGSPSEHIGAWRLLALKYSREEAWIDSGCQGETVLGQSPLSAMSCLTSSANRRLLLSDAIEGW